MRHRLLSGLSLVIAFAACGQHSSSTVEPATQEPAANAEPEEAPPRGPRWSTDSYDLAATADASGYHVGQLGQVTVTLQPKSGWHVNQEYPVRIELHGPASLGVAKSVLERGDAAEFDEQHFKFAAPLTPSTAGDQQLLATVSFAVCERANCLPQTETLSLPVQVR